MSGGGGGSGAALRAAASAGDVTACARYIGTARSVRFSRDELGRSALHLSSSAGHSAVVHLLLNAAAPREIDSPDGAGCTALQRAAADGHEDVLRLLLSRGPNIDLQDTVHGNSALHEAAWKGYSRTVALLASAGADLSRANAGGFTALHLCCQNGHNQTCRELLLAGCDPDLQNNYGDTALHTAARYGHAGVTRILISAQCRVSEQNKNGDTALHIASAMGRRKLTRILLEAGCDKSIRNKQNETSKDIALRKDLNEIITILDQCNIKKEKKLKAKKQRSKSKVRFDAKTNEKTLQQQQHWSPYGCHYYPDPEAFPSPRLDSLPAEPLKRGEQYYLDLAGNICKGPVGVGYTCYCAPLFRHLEARLERDKRELHRAQIRLGQRVAGLEQKLNRSGHGRRSERVISNRDTQQFASLTRSKSLEMLDKIDCNTPLQATRSMDELEAPEQKIIQEEPRQTVKELVARIQNQISTSASIHNISNNNQEDHSESSDDEDNPLRLAQHRGPMGDSNLASIACAMPNYENIPGGNVMPRSRIGMYSPTVVGTTLVDSNTKYVEPVIKESSIKYKVPYNNYNVQTRTNETNAAYNNVSSSRYPDVNVRSYETNAYVPNPNKYYEPNTTRYTKYSDMNTRFAKLRVLDNSKMMDNAEFHPESANKIFESTTRMLENPQDVIDRDTNNDSGYSTKVYGSSKGNSPSLSGGQIDGDRIGASSLV